VTAWSVSRRQFLGGLGVLTATAVLPACTSPQPPAPGAGGTPSAGAAPSANPSVTPARLGNVMTGIDEVHVDAMTGKIISFAHESPAAEKKEAAEDAKAAKAATAKAKKP